MSTTTATDIPVPPPQTVVEPEVAATSAAAPPQTVTVDTTPAVAEESKPTEAVAAAAVPAIKEDKAEESASAAEEVKPVATEAEKPVEAATVTATPAVETESTTTPTPAVPSEPTITPAEHKPISIISSTIAWPALDPAHPLTQFQLRLPQLLEAANHNLIWGITLSATVPIPFHTTLILQKFLRANYNNVEGAYTQLLETLKWRKEYNPEAAVDEIFSESKFGGLGWVSKLKVAGESTEKVVTWNVYGACKDTKKTFGDLDSFLRWRIALMELGVNALELPKATVPIPDYNPTAPGTALDPYQMIQLHDYQNVSFFRLDSATKAASKKTIDVMAHYYPELLSSKLFVNVPVVMGWVFSAMKAFLSKETTRKFKVITSGRGVASELGEDVPKIYGGKGADLAEVGLSPKLMKDASEPEPVAKLGKKASKASLDKSALKGKASKATLNEKAAVVAESPKVEAADVAVTTATPEVTTTTIAEKPEATVTTTTTTVLAEIAEEAPVAESSQEQTQSDLPPLPPAKDEETPAAVTSETTPGPTPPEKDLPAITSTTLPPPPPPEKDTPSTPTAASASLSTNQPSLPADKLNQLATSSADEPASSVVPAVLEAPTESK